MRATAVKAARAAADAPPLLALRVGAAIHHDIGSGDLLRRRAGQERDRLGDILRFAVVAQRDQAALRIGGLTVYRVHITFRRTGFHHIDSNAARPQIPRQPAR